jgi:hypothetical protein
MLINWSRWVAVLMECPFNQGSTLAPVSAPARKRHTRRRPARHRQPPASIAVRHAPHRTVANKEFPLEDVNASKRRAVGEQLNPS